jgi:hypothetical protein
MTVLSVSYRMSSLAMARSKARTSSSCSRLERGVLVICAVAAQPASKKNETDQQKFSNRLLFILRSFPREGFIKSSPEISFSRSLLGLCQYPSIRDSRTREFGLSTVLSMRQVNLPHRSATWNRQPWLRSLPLIPSVRRIQIGGAR